MHKSVANSINQPSIRNLYFFLCINFSPNFPFITFEHRFRLTYKCSRDRYKTHIYCLAVEASFYSDVVECLPLDPVAQVRFPSQACWDFSVPCDIWWPVWVCGLCLGHQDGMSRNYNVVPSRLWDKSI